MVDPAGTSTSWPSIVSFGMPGSPARPDPASGRPPRLLRVGQDPPLDLGPEVANQALHRPGRSVAERADGVTLDFLGDVQQQVDLLQLGTALRHPRHHPPQPAGSFAARRALPAGLVHVEFRQPRDRPYHVRGPVHHYHARGAEAALYLPQAVEVHPHRVADLLRDQWYRSATGDHRQQVVPATTHATAVLVDQGPQGNAHLVLDHARLVHVAGDAKDFGAGVVGTA